MATKEKEIQIEQAIQLEREVVATMGKIKAYENSIGQLRRNIQKCTITLKEIGTLEDQRTFGPLGRAFLLRSKSDVSNDIQQVIQQNEKDIVEFEKLRNHLVTKQKEKENQLQEQIKHLKI